MPFRWSRPRPSYELRVEPLFRPGVWRLLAVESRCRLDLLAEVVAASFALEPSAHLFVLPGERSGSWSSEEGESGAVRLGEVLDRPGELLLYWHGGFGGTLYNLRLEGRLSGKGLPPFDCLGGEGAVGDEQAFDLEATRERLARFHGVPL